MSLLIINYFLKDLEEKLNNNDTFTKPLKDWENLNNVLIVDDDAFNLNSLKLIFSRFNINCDTAICGQIAINLVK